MVPALTPLRTSHSRLSFTLYLGSQLRTGRCLNNKLLSLSPEHLTETNKAKSLKSSFAKVHNTCLNFVRFDHKHKSLSRGAVCVCDDAEACDSWPLILYLKSFFTFSPTGNCRLFFSNSLSKSGRLYAGLSTA